MENDIFNPNMNRRQMRRPVSDKAMFDHLAKLYIRYIETYKKLEDVYDQILHPQKRAALFPILKNTLQRVLELKDGLIKRNKFTNAINSKFINLDEHLYDLKINVDKLEIPIPRYVREVNKAKLDERDHNIRKFISNQTEQDLPEEEEIVYRDFEKLTEETAMHCILINERGRQGIKRGRELMKIKDKKYNKGSFEPKLDEKSVKVILKYYRAYVDRKIIHNARLEEMKFLGMEPEDDEELDDLMGKVEKIREKRRDIRDREYKNFKDKTIEIKEKLEKTEKPDIKEKMLFERRMWITDVYENMEGKNLPKYVEEFYQRNNDNEPLTKEERDQRKKEAAQKKKDKKKAKKKKKKKTEKEEFLSSRTPEGPMDSKYLGLIKQGVEGFSNNWAGKDETDNFEQKLDRALIVNKVMPEIELTVEDEVDAIIKVELKNLYTKLGVKKVKLKKKDKKKIKEIRNQRRGIETKKKGKKGKKKKKAPGEKAVGKRAPIDLMGDLAIYGVLKRLKPAKLIDFKGDYDLMRTITESQAPSQPDPSLAQVRNLCSEVVGIPLGAGFFDSNVNRTYLFYGPQGTGKTLMVKALATECRAMLLDISPYVVADVFTEKKKILELMYKVFKVAIEYQPAIILIDEVEHYFPSKKAKKKGKKGYQLAGRCSKFKKQLLKQIKKHLKPEDRVAVIACTNKPYYCNMKEMKKNFSEKIYFPYPSYSARQMLFKHLLKKHDIPVSETFPISQFAFMTEGYTAGSVIFLFFIFKFCFILKINLFFSLKKL